jgi:hypothetical protein
VYEVVGTPSDDLPEVLASGHRGVRHTFVSLSGKYGDHRDLEFLEWHAYDHRPEQHRIDALRGALRLISTPACRAARAHSGPRYDAVDHVMTYFFSDIARGREPFRVLGTALGAAGRIPALPPTVERGVYTVSGAIAAPRVVVGADVLPWWPMRGVYLLIEHGHSSPEGLVDVDGVAGAWWCTGDDEHSELDPGLQMTYCFLDDEPVDVAERLAPVLARRWDQHGVEPLLAAPMHPVTPETIGRHLP